MNSAAFWWIPLVQPELHRLAHHYMSREKEGPTLQTTALVNEAYSISCLGVRAYAPVMKRAAMSMLFAIVKISLII